jgi:hypothetical protein
MRYRAHPVAPRTSSRATKLRSKGLRRALTLFGGAFVIGGLLRLATDDTIAIVATGDLSTGPTRAASSEPEPEHDDKQLRGNPLDAAIITMLNGQD